MTVELVEIVVQKAIIKVTKIETTVSTSSAKTAKGVSVVLHDFNLKPTKAVVVMSAIKLAVFLALEGKVPTKDIHITLHGSLSTDL
ncbi:MAG: hypothetical protein A2320_02820 [Pseudomonadales bacterium GWC2_63_15]|nr:MAG: hypothetical protein A2320_02820 [Pseudomonadales bacterium GWC2_63_15]